MNIVQINSEDQGGGAAKIAYQLYRNCLEQGYETKFVVGRRNTNEEHIKLLANDFGTVRQQILGKIDKYFAKVFGQIRGSFIIRDLLHLLANPKAKKTREQGKLDYFYSGSEYIFDQVGYQPDVVHLHNLHGKYFDLKVLPKLSSNRPVIWTLHDQWAFTGICAHTIDCERWKTGCGNCPQIGENYPPPDSTDYNWNRKKEIYCKSSLIVCTPSKWLYQKAKISILNAKDVHYIPNGVDINIFKPQEKDRIRKKIDLPNDELLLLYAANKGSKSPWKDYNTVIESAEKIAEQLYPEKIRLINPGYINKVEKKNNLIVHSLPYVSSEKEIAKYYQAADLYLHAANAENLPLAILEAMSCGIPVVASNVGGIPEIIEDGKSGFLVKPNDPLGMADRAVTILKDDNLYSVMCKRSREIIENDYSLDTMLNRYDELYQSVI